jgi:hypothetical protein
MSISSILTTRTNDSIPTEEQIQKNLKDPIIQAEETTTTIKSYSYEYSINNKEFPFTPGSPKSIHHAIAITTINLDVSCIIKPILRDVFLTLLLTSIFIFLFCYLNNPLWLIGAGSSLALGIKCLYFKVKLYLSLIKYENIIKANLTRKQDDPKKQSVLALMPIPFSDYNGAFISPYGNDLGTLATKYNLDVYYPLSVDHINKIFKEKKYDHLFICGHGSPNSISFTNSFKLTASDIPKLTFNLNKNAEVGILSCSTGTLGGIAQKIAATSKRKVFAPKEPSSSCNIELQNNGSIKYKFFKLIFESKYYLINFLENFFLPFHTDITREIDSND